MPHRDDSDPLIPALRFRSVRKSFVEGIPVLDGVDLDVARGEVTALVGANGSGKSTLVKMIAGYHQPDAGSVIEIDGEQVPHHVMASTIRARGVRFVHQDIGFAPDLSVLDNMEVEDYPRNRFGRIRWRAAAAQLRADLTRFAVAADPFDTVSALSRGTLAQLAIVRAVRRRGGEAPVAIVLDEPTAALGQSQAREVLQWMRTLADQSRVGVLVISHRLDEILEHTDSVAVLRGGRVVAHRRTSEIDHDELVEQIVGRRIDQFYPHRDHRGLGGELLRVQIDSPTVHELSFSVRSGEVLGVTGLPGSGFEDVPYLLLDDRAGASGTVEINGQRLDLQHSSIAARIAAGLALAPSERKRRALAPAVDVRRNLTLPALGSFRRNIGLSDRLEREYAEELVDRFGVSVPSIDASTSQLSGGNQQKVVLAKWLATKPDVLVVHEPTEAVDVGAKADIFALLAQAVGEGAAAVIASIEYEDLAHLCDRVLVMGRGSVREILVGEELTPEALTAAAFRAAAAEDAVAASDQQSSLIASQ